MVWELREKYSRARKTQESSKCTIPVRRVAPTSTSRDKPAKSRRDQTFQRSGLPVASQREAGKERKNGKKKPTTIATDPRTTNKRAIGLNAAPLI
jgi:hypothetical protein